MQYCTVIVTSLAIQAYMSLYSTSIITEIYRSHVLATKRCNLLYSNYQDLLSWKQHVLYTLTYQYIFMPRNRHWGPVKNTTLWSKRLFHFFHDKLSIYTCSNIPATCIIYVARYDTPHLVVHIKMSLLEGCNKQGRYWTKGP